MEVKIFIIFQGDNILQGDHSVGPSTMAAPMPIHTMAAPMPIQPMSVRPVDMLAHTTPVTSAVATRGQGQSVTSHAHTLTDRREDLQADGTSRDSVLPSPTDQTLQVQASLYLC